MLGENGEMQEENISRSIPPPKDNHCLHFGFYAANIPPTYKLFLNCELLIYTI